MPDREISSDSRIELHREIAAARSIDELKEISGRMLDTAEYALRSNVSTKELVQLISRFNDAITLRLIALLESTEGVRLPEGATFLVLGSEGRGEQTLRTDQDNAIVYNDDLPARELRNVERFATRIVDALEEIGVPRCPGNIMASTPEWRHSVSEWKKLLDEWITAPTPEHILNFGMIQDLRALHGDDAPVMQLRDHICAEVQNHAFFFPNMACHVVRFPSPFTIFGRIRGEHDGVHEGMVDPKKMGIFAITTGTSLLALEFGTIGGNTWEKLDFLEKTGVFTSDDHKVIATGFSFLVHLRLQQQLRDLAANRKPSNYIDPQLMNAAEYEQFRHALKGVEAFLWIFREHYLLDFISV